jgi:hypothetical protein
VRLGPGRATPSASEWDPGSGEGKLTADEACPVVQEVSSSLKITFHLWGGTSTSKVNQKVAPRPGALWTPVLATWDIRSEKSERCAKEHYEGTTLSLTLTRSRGVKKSGKSAVIFHDLPVQPSLWRLAAFCFCSKAATCFHWKVTTFVETCEKVTGNFLMCSPGYSQVVPTLFRCIPPGSDLTTSCWKAYC